MTAADFYEGIFPKAQGRCALGSWHELLYAALLEADPDTTHFRPRGRRLTYRYRGRQQIYQPDFVATGQATRLVTIKPVSEISQQPWPWLSRVTAHCAEHGDTFTPIASETIDARACLAFNWLQISRFIMALAESTIDIDGAVKPVRRALSEGGQTYDTLRAAVPPADETTRAALPFVLLHRGEAECPALSSQPLHGSMLFWPL